MVDPFTDVTIYDVMEWTLNLQAPDGANGLMVHYVFLSEEYDDYIGTTMIDRFYIVLEAGSTNGGAPTVINYGECRDGVGADFGLPECDLESEECCYIGLNSDFSECCWYDGCPDGTWTTDISGTGYSCAPDQTTDSSAYGSSTGWIVTEWPIDAGEVFSLTFHIHDTGDHIFDSEVILDKVLFTPMVNPGTRAVP
jgi:hypothetical protein